MDAKELTFKELEDVWEFGNNYYNRPCDLVIDAGEPHILVHKKTFDHQMHLNVWKRRLREGRE